MKHMVRWWHTFRNRHQWQSETFRLSADTQDAQGNWTESVQVFEGRRCPCGALDYDIVTPWEDMVSRAGRIHNPVLVAVSQRDRRLPI
jgi:hypothetical protein